MIIAERNILNQFFCVKNVTINMFYGFFLWKQELAICIFVSSNLFIHFSEIVRRLLKLPLYQAVEVNPDLYPRFDVSFTFNLTTF